MSEREARFTFDAIADEYARTRPSYPAPLIDDLVAAAALGPGSRVLEIGCGPGNATALLAESGCAMLCLEPGPRLAALARQRLADRPVEVIETTFEDWPLEPGVFDLVFAAQSFHWVDPAVRFVKARDALVSGGTLAIFANRPESADAPLDRELRAIYARLTPALGARGVATNTTARFRALFEESSLFAAANCREYAWTAEYRADEYLALLRTHSDHQLLAPDVLENLLSAIRRAIEGHGGVYRQPHMAVLAFACAL